MTCVGPLPEQERSCREYRWKTGSGPTAVIRNSALDALFGLEDHVRRTEVGRPHGPRRLAAESWPRTV